MSVLATRGWVCLTVCNRETPVAGPSGQSGSSACAQCAKQRAPCSYRGIGRACGQCAQLKRGCSFTTVRGEPFLDRLDDVTRAMGSMAVSSDRSAEYLGNAAQSLRGIEARLEAHTMNSAAYYEQRLENEEHRKVHYDRQDAWMLAQRQQWEWEQGQSSGGARRYTLDGGITPRGAVEGSHPAQSRGGSPYPGSARGRGSPMESPASSARSQEGSALRVGSSGMGAGKGKGKEPLFMEDLDSPMGEDDENGASGAG